MNEGEMLSLFYHLLPFISSFEYTNNKTKVSPPLKSSNDPAGPVPFSSIHSVLVHVDMLFSLFFFLIYLGETSHIISHS